MHNAQNFGLRIVANGSCLPEYTKDGKTYIAAPADTDYQIRILVPTIPGNLHRYKRFLAVISVDGLDVMTGKRATSQSSGYVVTPPSRVDANDIPGFRLNDKEVARFRFGDREDSYAAQLDKPENIGVIGVIFFAEREPVYRDLTLEVCGPTRGGGHTFGGGPTRVATSRGAGHDVGTAFGQRDEHVVNRTQFERAEEVARFVLEYASFESLKAAGVIKDSVLGNVSAFGDEGCVPPKGWKG